MNTIQSTQQTVDFLRDRIGAQTCKVSAGIILGSGLGGLVNQIQSPASIGYEEIPGFVRSTAGGHQGKLVFGLLDSIPVVAMAGRFHRYEGWTNTQATFPVSVIAGLGAKTLVVSNAAGGVNPKLCVGDIMIIRDHLNWLSGPPSQVTHQDRSAITFGGQHRGLLYDADLASLAKQAAMQNGFATPDGTYLATLGPNYETRAEYRMMRRIGVDAVGMSTVPEVLVAAANGMRVLGLSMISNVADPDRPNIADHQEVLEAGKQAAAKMESIVKSVLKRVG